MSSISSLAGGGASLAALQQNLFQRLDSDSSGTISLNEFVAGAPKGVSADQATALYKKIDTNGTGALTSDQLAQGLAANKPDKSNSAGDPANLSSNLSGDVLSTIIQMLQQVQQQQSADASSATGTTNSTNTLSATSSTSSASASGTSSTDKLLTDLAALLNDISALGSSNNSYGPPSAQDIFSKLDKNGDGAVSKDEFVAGAPPGVSADQATSLFNSIDTSGTGSISEQQFADSLHNGPGNSQTADAASSSNTANSSDTSKSSDTLLLQLLQAIESYTSNSYSDNTNYNQVTTA